MHDSATVCEQLCKAFSAHFTLRTSQQGPPKSPSAPSAKNTTDCTEPYNTQVEKKHQTNTTNKNQKYKFVLATLRCHCDVQTDAQLKMNNVICNMLCPAASTANLAYRKERQPKPNVDRTSVSHNIHCTVVPYQK